MSVRKLSIVIPVRNEHENIGRCLEGLWDALEHVEHEILIAYDKDDDTTLPAIEQTVRKSPNIRLVKNHLGPSASFAIRSGLLAAEGDVIVVTMADLSDPPEAILRMADAVRAGADVVSGSRYMRGGRQIGGPLVKTLLSRAAGLSLFWIAGVGTHDATTSFRAFSRRHLTEISLESDTGFTFGIEATVKAHLRGLVVSEVPVTWSDRTAGESNFRVAKWLGAYLKWYRLAMTEPLLVWGLWAGSGAVALATGTPPIFVAATLGTSFALILVARRLRGRMIALDGLIPLGTLIPRQARTSPLLGTLAAGALSAIPLATAWNAGRRRLRTVPR